MTVDPDSRAFPYQQLAAQYRAAIQAGTLGPKLPSVATLAADAGVSVHTAHKAVKLLEDDGLVEAIPGRGVFVIGRLAGPAESRTR